MGAGSSGSPMTPVEAWKISPGWHLSLRGERFRNRRDRLDAGAAGERIGIAGIDDQRSRAAAFELFGAPIDRRRARFRVSEDAGDRGAGRQDGEQHIGPVLVANAGLADGEAARRLSLAEPEIAPAPRATGH